MKRLFIVGIVMGFASFLALTPVYAAMDTDKTFNEIKADLQKNGVVDEDINGVKKSVGEMLEKGATKDEIEKPLGDLSKNGVKGKDFKKSVDSMNDIVRKGKSPKDAGNIVSHAVHKAQAEGLKGAALADKVHEAVKEMQTEKRESIHSKLEQMGTGNAEKKTNEGSGKEGSPFRGVGHMGGGHGHGR